MGPGGRSSRLRHARARPLVRAPRRRQSRATRPGRQSRRIALEPYRRGARTLAPPDGIAHAVETLASHYAQRRPLESRHPLARRRPPAPTPPVPRWDQAGAPPDCAMHALDRWFVRLVDANPALRVRVGNPDELRSNHMGAALERLRHRVNVPEPGVADALDGAVLTPLNEAAVAGAALANKGGQIGRPSCRERGG